MQCHTVASSRDVHSYLSYECERKLRTIYYVYKFRITGHVDDSLSVPEGAYDYLHLRDKSHTGNGPNGVFFHFPVLPPS